MGRRQPLLLTLGPRAEQPAMEDANIARLNGRTVTTTVPR